MAAKEVKEKVKSGKPKPKKKTKSAPSKIRTSKKSAEISDAEAAITGKDPAPPAKKSRAKTAAVKKSKSAINDTDPAPTTNQTPKKPKLGKPSAKHHQPSTSAPLAAKKSKSADKNPIGELKSALKIQGAITPRAVTTAVKSGVKPSPGGALVASRISAKTPAVARSAAPASAVKPAADKPTAAAATSTRLRTPGKHRQHGAGGNARSGQQQAGAGGGEAATQSARSRSNLLTARSHRSSLSSYGHGESTVSPYGDVRTMVCDVSPVPSDVESIDFSNNTGRSQALRVGRDTDNPTFGGIAKKQMYKDDSSKAARQSANKITTQTDGSEPATGIEHQLQRSEELPIGGATAKNDVLVRIVPDSAKSPASANQKSAPEKKSGSKTGSSPQTKSDDKGAKGKPGPGKQAQQSKQATASSKFVRNSTIVKTTLAVCNAGSTGGQNKQESESRPHDESNTENLTPPDGEKVTEFNDPETTSGTSKSEHILDSAELGIMSASNIRIPADEECCKAYTVLNNRGFKISLHTIRKALLTPSEYRMLLNGPRNGVSVLPSH